MGHMGAGETRIVGKKKRQKNAIGVQSVKSGEKEIY